MNRSVILLVASLLSVILLVACGSSGDDGELLYINNTSESSIRKEILKSANNVDHSKNFSLNSYIGNIYLPANSVQRDYNIEITRTATNNLSDKDTSLLKSMMRINNKADFLSAILGVNLSYSNHNNARASVNIEGNGIPLMTTSSIIINLDTYIFDWNKWYYYLAFKPNENSAWNFTPLKAENFSGKLNQLTVNINKLSKYYVILRMPQQLSSDVIQEIDTNTSTDIHTQTNTDTSTDIHTQTNTNTQTNTDTSTDTNLVTGISVNAQPNELVATSTIGLFEENMNISVWLEYTGNNPFQYTTPTIEFLSFSPFDLGNSIKSKSEDGVYSYTYSRFISPDSDFAGQASFTLTLPTKNVAYDANKFPSNIFVTAKFKSKENQNYQTSPISISFKSAESIRKESEEETATSTVVTSMKISTNPSKLVLQENETILKDNIVISGEFCYSGATPTFDLTPLYFEFTSASPFKLGNNIISNAVNDVYTYKYIISDDELNIDYSSSSVLYNLTLPLKDTVYDASRHPSVIFVKSKYNGYESNQAIIRIVNENSGQLKVTTAFPGHGNIINGSGTVTLNSNWTGGSAPFTIKYLSDNKILAQETVASKNTTQALITGNMIGDSNGSPKFITVKVIDSNKNSFEAVSDGIIVDTQKPVLTANIINDHIFGTREIVRIEIASNKTVNAPVVISNNVNATIEGEDTVGTKFIYDLQLSEDFTTGSYTVTITAKDLTEPAETANISTTSVEFYVDTNKTYPFAQGDGSEGNPFLISNAEELNQVRYYPDFYYKQIADIDLEEFINETTGSGWEPINSFSKTYDGNNYHISNLRIDRKKYDYIGLFGTLTKGATIKNLSVDSKYVYGKNYVGIIAGLADKCKISNCHVSGNASGTQYIGGISGKASIITNCTSNIEIGGIQKLGGIVGESGYVDCCQTCGNVIGDKLSDSIGGIVGVCLSNRINNCFSEMNSVSGQYNVGGIAGSVLNTEIANCKSQIGKIEIKSSNNSNQENDERNQSYNLGGILGKAEGENVKIISCDCLSDIFINTYFYGKNIGGIAGLGNSTNLKIEKCYSKINVFYTTNTITQAQGYETPIAGILGYSSSLNTLISRCVSDIKLIKDGNNGICSIEQKSRAIFGCGICGNDANGKISNCLAFMRLNCYSLIGRNNNTIGLFEATNCLSIDTLIEFNDLDYRSTSNYGGIGYKCKSISNCFAIINNQKSFIPNKGGRISSMAEDNNSQINNYSWSLIPFNASNCSKTNKNGETVASSDFWGASTQETFWANPDKLGWDFDNVWEFRAGYNLPQLRGMPAMEDPDFIN